MNETVFTILLIAVALAMPAWMARRKTNKRPYLVGWLLIVGLLILPYGLTVWLHPEWLNYPVPFLAKHLVLLPFFLSLCTLGGGLLYLMAPLALALILGFGKAFKDVEWLQDEDQNHNSFNDSDPHEEMYGSGSLYEEELREGYEDGRENAW